MTDDEKRMIDKWGRDLEEELRQMEEARDAIVPFMPLNTTAGNFDYDYSSGRLDYQTYFR